MQILTYIVISIVVFAVCALAMSVGLIFRNKTFKACGNAVRDFDGEPIDCAVCGGKPEGGSCKRKSTTPAEADA